uniref:Transcription factor TFIIIC triple barrel domain-containing protein n=1 Tax=Noccaea caerulescens TaxID=107243 RepID=A0A1J3DP97_NOCCA
MNNESVKLSKEEDDEYVLIDLGDVGRHIDIPSEAPYTLSGLDTLNPRLTIDGKIKLVGEYIETIGTCLAFSENEVSAGENQKLVEPVAKLHKILKFKLAAFYDKDDEETKTTSA